jgi:hypothetical protein
MAKKRKGPVAGGQKQPPSSKKAKKRAGQDLYEAEDSDPDEVKHGNRYDVRVILSVAESEPFACKPPVFPDTLN